MVKEQSDHGKKDYFVPVFSHFLTIKKRPGDPETLDSKESAALARRALRWQVVHMLLASWWTDATGSLSSDAHPLFSSSSSRAPHDHLGQTRALPAYSLTEETPHILLVKYVEFFPVQGH